MTKLNEFIAQVKTGLAKTTHFSVELTLPDNLIRISDYSSHLNKIVLFCDQAQLPGLAFSTGQVRSFGEIREIPYEKLFEPVTLNFYVDADMVVKKLFDDWMGLIQDPDTRLFSYPSIYLTDKIDIIVQDIQDNESYRCSLHKCFPKSLTAIQLDYASKDVMKFGVTLSYQYATSQRISRIDRIGESSIGVMTPQMPEYNYGFDSFSQIPANYFTDFYGFQNKLASIDLTQGGVQSLTSIEDIGVITGFGGMFG